MMGILLAFSGAGAAHAQVAPVRPPQARSSASLEVLARRLSAEAVTGRRSVDSLLAVGGIDRRILLSVGDSAEYVYELVSVDRGRPVWYGTHNAAAVRSVQGHRLASGGGLGLDLTGDGLVLGIWDGGNVYAGHRELAGRVLAGDHGPQITNHATHVAGTLAGSGSTPAARGVAPRALVRSWDWSDDVPEMARAAADGLRVSNHSYGSLGGWVWNVRNTGRWAWMGDPARDTIRDSRFGAYDAVAARFDEVAYHAPDYLIVRSAGNERADRGPAPGTPHDVFDGGWKVSSAVREPDGGESGHFTLLDAGNAKNVLVVGAVEDVLADDPGPDDIRLLDLSGIGPTADGRIKPDVVASGHLLYSSVARGPDEYAWSSGTSMASPAVAGVAGLLQGLYSDLVGVHPTSALLRALLIHSATEAGPGPGPDYRHGWGLVDAGRAASLLLAHRADAPRHLEAVLDPASTFETTVQVGSDGVLRVTLAWTDPPGAEQGLDGTVVPTLVHDLDLEVRGGRRFLPWLLDPASPSEAATRGVNRSDNVEQVYYTGVEPGEYSVRVTHQTGTGPQPFALLLGEVADVPPPDPSVVGRITMARTGSIGPISTGVGLAGVEVELIGLTSQKTRTGPDGRFLFEHVVPGEYVLRPDDSFYRIDDPVRPVVVTAGSREVDFMALSAARLSSARFHPADRLLFPGTWDTSVETEYPTAGGVYGVRLDLASSTPLAGGSVIWDLAFEPRFATWAGDVGKRYLDLATQWTISEDGSGGFTQWMPALWSAPGLAAGEVLRLPLSILDREGRLAGLDTLVWVTGALDDVPPVPFAEIPVAGRAFAPVGEPYLFQAHLLDGSPIRSARILVRDRSDPREVLQDLPLNDTGDLKSFGDRTANDRLFSRYFVPRDRRDFRLDLVAEDERGNRTVREGIRWLSSRPFEPRGTRLLVGWSGSESRTDAVLSLAREAGFELDSWEFDVRGDVSAPVLTAFRTVIWSRDTMPIDRPAERLALQAAVDGGTRLLIVGPGAAHDVDPSWSEHVLHAGQVGELPIPTWAGDPRAEVAGAAATAGWSGVRMTLRPGTRIGSFLPADGAVPLLTIGDRVVAYRYRDSRHQALGLGFSPLDVESPDDGVRLVRWLFAELEVDDSLAPVPSAPLLSAPLDGSTALPDGDIELVWADLPFTRFLLEIADEPDFRAPIRAVEILGPSFLFEGPASGLTYWWRVRGLSAAGAGPWSEVRRFGIPTPNRAPLPTTAVEPMVFRERGHPALRHVDRWFMDPDGDLLTFTGLISDPSILSVQLTGNTLYVRPLAPGTASVTVRAFDPAGLADELSFPVTVVANRAPRLAILAQSIGLIVGTDAVEVPYDASDDDADPIEIRAMAEPADLVSVTVDVGRFRVAPLRAGTGRFVVVARDSLGSETRSEIPITVRGNSAPVFASGDVSIFETFMGAVPTRFFWKDLVGDPDEDRVEYSAVLAEPGIIEIGRTDSTLDLRPVAIGTALIDLSARDPYGLGSSHSIRVRVGPDPNERKPLPTDWSLAALYPIPAIDVLHVVVEAPVDATVSIEAIDLLGRRIVHLPDQPVAAGRARWSIPVSGLGSGVFRLRVVTPGGVFIRSFVVAR